VIAKSFARIHRRNLIAQGIVALTFSDESGYDKAEVGQKWSLPKLREELENGSDTITAGIEDTGDGLTLSHDFSEHEREILLAGGLLSYLRKQESGNGDSREAEAGGGRAEQEDAGARAESEDGAGNGSGVIRESGQGVGGHHE
jgi:3-isopropylmalate dehydratase small subunit